MIYCRSLIFFVLHNLSGIIAGTFLVIVWPFLPYAIHRRLVSAWILLTQLLLRICCGIRIRIVGERPTHLYPCVVMANHQSTWETLFLQHYFGPASAVAKKELLRIPFFGWGLATMRPITIDRANPVQALKDIKSKGLARLKQGNNLLIFPEGTRVAPGQKGSFARSGADIACTADVALVPVAHNAGECWPHKTIMKYPGTITVVIGPAISTEGRERKELTEEVKNWIQTQLDQLPPGRDDGRRPWLENADADSSRASST
mgnify:CR=1 FL=1